MKNILIVKLSEAHGDIPKSQEGIQERARGAWKRRIETTENLNHMIVLNEQKIIGEYTITNATQVKENNQNRVVFDLTDAPQFFTGKSLDYPTSNVASDMDTKTFLSKLK